MCFSSLHCEVILCDCVNICYHNRICVYHFSYTMPYVFKVAFSMRIVIRKEYCKSLERKKWKEWWTVIVKTATWIRWYTHISHNRLNIFLHVEILDTHTHIWPNVYRISEWENECIGKNVCWNVFNTDSYSRFTGKICCTST